MTVNLLAFAGSTRAGSYNQALLELAIASARRQGAQVSAVRLKDFELPLFDEDLEAAGVPRGAIELKSLFKHHDGFLIASPEYNHSVSAVLKNAIDWVSRPSEGESLRTLSAFRGKVAGLMGASLSPFGSVRSVAHLRLILSALQSLVVPEQVLVPSTHASFNADGTLKDHIQHQFLDDLTGSVISLCGGRS